MSIARTALRVSKLSPARASPQLAAQVHRQTDVHILYGQQNAHEQQEPPVPRVDLVIPWNEAEIRAATDKHCLATWGVKDQMFPNAIVSNRGKGSRVYDMANKDYVDLASQAVCSNLGHDVPPSVKAAIQAQLTDLPYVYGGGVLTEARAKLAKRCAELTPATITSFLFPCTGSEANEVAARIAQRVTGRPKVMTAYRSYHGGSTGSLAATGDPRRNFLVSMPANYVKFLDPNPYCFSWGASEEEATERALSSLEQQIIQEGAETISLVLLESIVGANGFVKYPAGYLSGLRKLTRKYGILLGFDEVMMGFGRTGYNFGCDSYVETDGVAEPDIITSAKGLSSAIMPISMVGVSPEIEQKLRSQPIGWGTTFHAHPVACAAANAVLEHMDEANLWQRVRDMAPLLRDKIQKLEQEHPDVLCNARSFGLCASVDVLARSEERTAQPHKFRGLQQTPHADMGKLKKIALEEGVMYHTMGPHINIAPPYIVTEEELDDGFERLGRAIKRALY